MKNQIFILIFIFFAGLTSCQKEVILPASQDHLNASITTRSGSVSNNNGGDSDDDIIDDNVTDPNEDEDFDKDKKNIGG